MVLCCGTGNGFSWTLMIGMVLMLAWCFFMMMKMHRKEGSMDCCTKSKTISDKQ